MAEAALLGVGIDALPSGMVLDDVGDEERTSDHPRERGSRPVFWQVISSTVSPRASIFEPRSQKARVGALERKNFFQSKSSDHFARI